MACRCMDCGKYISILECGKCGMCRTIPFSPKHTFDDFTSSRAEDPQRIGWLIVVRSIKLLHGGMKAYAAKA